MQEVHGFPSFSYKKTSVLPKSIPTKITTGWAVTIAAPKGDGNHKHPNTQQTSQGVSGGERKLCKGRNPHDRVFGNPFPSLRLLYPIFAQMSRGNGDFSRNSQDLEFGHGSNRFCRPNRRFTNSKNSNPVAMASAVERWAPENRIAQARQQSARR